MISRFTEMTREILGASLTGVYLHGSAALGCYQPAKSDLDFLVDTTGTVKKKAHLQGVCFLYYRYSI